MSEMFKNDRRKAPDTLYTLQRLAERAREINARNGWGLDFNFDERDCIPSYLALIHSEITEAYEAQTSAEQIRELGDVVVRCLDLSELIQRDGWMTRFEDGYVLDMLPLLPQRGMDAELLTLHTMTSQALESYRKAAADRVRGVVMLQVQRVGMYAWRMIRTFGDVQPESVIDEILIANAKRAYRHGGRRT